MEIWKDIEGYDGKYQVSSLGRIKSLNYKRTGREQCLEPQKASKGYLQVKLWKNGRWKREYVHRLVAKAFIPNPYNLPQVNHKNENKEDNRVENLEWCDPKYNNNYGTHIERVAEKHSKPILCVETGEIYPSTREAERKTGACHSNISRCCIGKGKTTKGYHWKYVEK